MTGVLGPWEPLDLSIVVELFADAESRWWVTGGHALELHLERTWRTHSDTDVSFCRQDAHAVRGLLDGWDIHVAAAGQLSPWNGKPLDIERHENDLWCRQEPSDPWVLDLPVSEGDDSGWVFRRDPSPRVPWDRAVLRSATRVPYLAPELQLLFKSKSRRPKDDADLREVLATLDDDSLAILKAQLPREHPWQALGRSIDPLVIPKEVLMLAPHQSGPTVTPHFHGRNFSSRTPLGDRFGSVATATTRCRHRDSASVARRGR